MGRLKRPRKAWGRPNFTDPFILIWLWRHGGKGKPYSFPCCLRVNGTLEDKLPAEFRFTRRTIYRGFRRLEQKGLLRKIEGEQKLTYELANPDEVSRDIMKLWQKVMPPITVSPGKSHERHERLKKSLEKIAADYDRLPPDFRKGLDDSVVEKKIFDTLVEGVIITRDLHTFEEAEVLQKRTGDLLETKRFVDREKTMKIVPKLLRSPDWKRPGQEKPGIRKNASSYKPASKVTVSEHPLCHECGVKMVYNNLGGFVCPKCGLQVD